MEIKREIELEKKKLKSYTEAIIEYDFKNAAYAAVNFKNLFESTLMNGMERLDESKLRKKEKAELTKQLFWGGKENKGTEEEKELKNLEALNSWAESKLESMSYKQKEKVVEDMLQYKKAWSEVFSVCSKIFKRIKETEEKRKKGNGKLPSRKNNKRNKSNKSRLSRNNTAKHKRKNRKV